MNEEFEQMIKRTMDSLGMNDPIKHTCQTCGSEFESVGPFDFTCSEACQLALEAKEAEERRQFQLERIAKLRADAAAIVMRAVPPRLARTDTADPRFNAKAWKEIQAWKPTADQPWLGLVGTSGTCKTRMAILRASQLLADFSEQDQGRPRFEYVAAYQLAQLAINQYSDNRETKADACRELERLHRADLLLLDDLDKTRFTPAIAEVFFSLIDHRHGRELPTLWTANSTVQQIGAMLPEQYSEAFAGRLAECSKIYQLKP